MADGAALLALWDAALPLAPAAREALLAGDEQCVFDGDDGEAPSSVGALRHRLLRRLAQRLGPTLALKSRCPACSDDASFEVSLPRLIDATTAAPGREHTLEHESWRMRFRLPAPDDMQALAHGAEASQDEDTFVRRMLERCVIDATDAGTPRALAELPAGVLERLSQQMDRLDPAANIAFEVACPACGATWSAPFDPGSALWSLVQRDAEDLLLEIDALARMYGWSEAEILAVPPTRRRAYLQLVRGG